MPKFSYLYENFRFVPESPRWLLRNGKVEQAHAVLKYIAKVNGSSEVSFSTVKAISDHERKEQEQQGSSGKRSQVTTA